MKLVLLIGLALALTACQENRRTITSELSVITDSGARMYTQSCRENEHTCNMNAIDNSRLMYVGESLYYTCGLNGKLYMSREQYKTATSLIEVDGTSCVWQVKAS